MTTPVTVPVVVLMLALVLAAWLLLDAPRAVRGTGPRTVSARAAAPLVGLVLVGGTTAESVVSQVAIDSRRSEVLAAIPMTPQLRKEVRDLVLAHDSWPAGRTSAGAATSVNDPMLMGGEGSEYYTSTIQRPVTRLHQSLGWGYSSYGRALVDPATPVTDALFAVRRRVTEDPVTGPTLLVREQSAPLVTVRQSVPRPSTRSGVWGVHERALGAPLYDVPTPTFSVRDAALAHSRTGYRAHSASPGAGSFTMRAVCAPGSEAFLWAPALVADYVVQGQTRSALPAKATRPGIYTGLPIQALGTVGPDGIIDVRFTMTTSDARLGHFPIGCLRPGALSAAVTALRGEGASDVETTDRSISFSVPRGEGDRSAVLAVPLLPGWSCTGPVSDQTPNGFEGLMAVPLTGDPGTVACGYRPPGLRLGLLIAGSVLSGGVLAALGLLVLRRRAEGRGSTARLTR